MCSVTYLEAVQSVVELDNIALQCCNAGYDASGRPWDKWASHGRSGQETGEDGGEKHSDQMYVV